MLRKGFRTEKRKIENHGENLLREIRYQEPERPRPMCFLLEGEHRGKVLEELTATKRNQIALKRKGARLFLEFVEGTRGLLLPPMIGRKYTHTRHKKTHKKENKKTNLPVKKKFESGT